MKSSAPGDSDNPFGDAYPWDYLKPENSDRPATLESLVGPYIEGNETVFDILCGFSPLSRFLLAKKCRVIGFDNSKQAIEYCKPAYPGGTYYLADDAAVEIPDRVDVLLHLGIPPGNDPWGLESRTETNTSMRTILGTLPRIIVLESATNYAHGYHALRSFVDGLEAYRVEAETIYELHPTISSINRAAPTTYKRVLSVYRKEGPLRSFCSLSDDTLARLFADVNPTSQAESVADLNLGFGFLYYALGRIVRPKLALVLGSQRGFSALCIALAIRDNADRGKLILVDAGYSDGADGKDLGMGGVAFWKDVEGVNKLLNRFGISHVMEVKVMRTSEFAHAYTAQKMPPVDLLLIDADHSYRGFKDDFETYSNFLAEHAVILCHDTEVANGFDGYSFGVGDYLRRVIEPSSRYEAMSLPVWPGLGIIRRAGSVRAPLETRQAKRSTFLETCLRTAYERVPLPDPIRIRLKEAFLSGLRRVFPGSF